MSVATISTISQHQIASSQPARSSVVFKHAAVGGVIGAAAAAALSFTGMPVIGALAAPIAAALGGAAGIVVGGLVGLLRSRSAVSQATAGASGIQAPVPPPPGSSSNGALPPALPGTA